MHPLTLMLCEELKHDDEPLEAARLRLMEQAVIGDEVTAICAGCGTVYESGFEPDQDAGYCETCGSRKVRSILILEGFI